MRKPYKPEEYWQQRFSTHDLDIASVGYLGLGLEYNTWLYHRRFYALTHGLTKLNINLNGKTLLDIGVGSGAYIPIWQKLGIANLIGLDITSVSVNNLNNLYPMYNFFQGDITADLSHFKEQTFDIVTAFDILFHVVDDHEFSKAMRNIANLIKPGGWLFLSDSICSKSWGPIYHEYHRSYDSYQIELKKYFLKIAHLEPIFYIMMTPLCGSQTLGKWVALETRIISKLGYRRETSWINHVIGTILFSIDTLLSYLFSNGPGLKFIYIQKNDHI